MEWIAGGILLLLTVFGIVSRKEPVPEACETSAVTRPFYRMAVYILRRLSVPAEGGSMRAKLQKALFRKNEENLRLLDPAGDIRSQLYLQFINKTAVCLLLLATGLFFALAVSCKESDETLLRDGNTLLRREYGKGHYEAELTAVAETVADAGEVFTETVEIPVMQRCYTEEELYELLPIFEEELETAVLAGNESPDRVCRDLDLVEGLEGYPFTVTWEYSDHTLIDHLGRLKEEIPQDGTLLTLDAKIRCDGLESVRSFSVMVWPREKDADTVLREMLQQALRSADEASRTSEEYVLPSEADGIKILWREEKKSSFLMLLLLVLAATAAVYVGTDSDLEKRVRERDAQMEKDYPEMVSKLSLYTGAGMTVRLAWKKMAAEYLKKQKRQMDEEEQNRKGRGKLTLGKRKSGDGKRYIYEEMVLTLREMESGVGELQAYRHFAKRCRLQKYVKLVSLLEQNVRLGTGGFLESLKKETGDALEERRSRAKTLGEEAGTKLLVPMLMMLAIVMVVIIVPAFMAI